AKRLGSDELWDKAEQALKDALGVRDVPYDIDEGGGVFYAPKIDIKVLDAIGREWQGPTIQIDLNLPERFDVTFVNAEGQREGAAGTVSVRRRGSREEERGVTVDAFIERLATERDTKALPADFSAHRGDEMPPA